MRSILILFVGVFSFLYIDLRFFRKRVRGITLEDSISIELSEKKEKLKKKKRKYKNRKYNQRQSFKQKHFKLKGSKSKDNRYSNQKDIRRMHTSYA